MNMETEALRSRMFRNRKLKWAALLAVPILAAGLLFALGLYRDRNPDSEVAALAEVLELRPGMSVAEIGAGKGRMTVLVARRLGSAGHMFSTDVSSARVRDIEQAVATAGLKNVTVIEGDETQTNLPEQCCEALFMSKVYHHFTEPSPMNESLFRSLRPGGRLAVIDFPPSFWRVWLRRPDGVEENRGGHGMPPRILIEEMKRAGFELERLIEDWWQVPESRYCAVFRKP